MSWRIDTTQLPLSQQAKARGRQRDGEYGDKLGILIKDGVVVVQYSTVVVQSPGTEKLRVSASMCWLPQYDRSSAMPSTNDRQWGRFSYSGPFSLSGLIYSQGTAASAATNWCSVLSTASENCHRWRISIEPLRTKYVS